ncbi:MAG: HxsD-like protein [Myxococcales bacterium]|nr:HxsD-like protein [Myxococcales bacterium]
MKELRFHRALYPGEAVDQAIKTFEPWATITRESSPTHWIVRLEARSAAAERRIAGELSNFALGLTVRRGPPDVPGPPRVTGA